MTIELSLGCFQLNLALVAIIWGRHESFSAIQWHEAVIRFSFEWYNYSNVCLLISGSDAPISELADSIVADRTGGTCIKIEQVLTYTYKASWFPFDYIPLSSFLFVFVLLTCGRGWEQSIMYSPFDVSFWSCHFDLNIASLKAEFHFLFLFFYMLKYHMIDQTDLLIFTWFWLDCGISNWLFAVFLDHFQWPRWHVL